MNIFSWFGRHINGIQLLKEQKAEEENKDLEELFEEADNNIKDIEELIEEVDELMYLELYKQIEDDFEKLNPTLSIETKIEKLEKFASNKCRGHYYLVDIYKKVFKQMFDHEFNI